MSMTNKTNALRMLESLGIAHEVVAHPVGEEHFDAVEVARLLDVSPKVLFKTLVAQSGSEEVSVFCIPGNAELDLKKAARIVGSRKVSLVPLKDLTSLTGYVRGGCSPIGMKKKYPTWIDQSASALHMIYVNAGARGLQVLVAPTELLRAVDASYADLVIDDLKE
jgi:Cys-tRNA(Pro)/Cys-tRNA(Cys) deacylase